MPERFCYKVFRYGSFWCLRTPKHPGLHRNARTVRHATVIWGDNECEPDDQEQEQQQ